MRLLFVVPHYFAGDSRAEASPKLKRAHASSVATVASRLQAVSKTVLTLHQTFGPSQAMIQVGDRRTIPANKDLRHDVHVVVVTCGDAHLMREEAFPNSLCHQYAIDDEPTNLGFHCHKILRDRWGNYDYYSYLEDDLSITDSWFFEKLRWFNSYVGDEKVLLPNRFEVASDLAYKKCYLDGDLAPHVTEPFQDVSDKPELQSNVMGRQVRFIRPLNPHSGCFFLNAAQMQKWIEKPDFGSSTSDFVGPLESAATLGIMKTFAIYKPAPENAGFLEIEHHGDQFIRLIKRQS